MTKNKYRCNRTKTCKYAICSHYKPHTRIDDCNNGGWTECKRLFFLSDNWKRRCVKVKP